MPFRLLAVAAVLLAPAAAAQSLPSWADPSVGAPPAASMSAPDDPGGTPGTPSTPPQSVPLDGGLGLLALAGGAYATRRIRQRQG